MHTRLVEDTTRQNIIEEVVRFDTSFQGKVWQCPFCNVNSPPYQLTVPPKLHKKDVLSQMSGKGEVMLYEKTRADSSKRVRLWITGTINDRRLYEEDPL